MEIGGDEGNLLVIMPAAEWTNRYIALLAQFAAPGHDLKKQDHGHRLHDVEVSLSEDNQTVIVYAN